MGAADTVFQDECYNDFSTSYALPASSLGLSDGGRVLQYLHSTRYIFFKLSHFPLLIAFSLVILCIMIDDLI